ncbi:9136_t:CDS:2 [Entrophospora sp. SA101]|nr:9136_t:CDS:2 [Entrophospora sp. SA101]
MKKFPPIHPGIMLKEDLLIEKNISQAQLAKDINLPIQQIREVCSGKKAITPDLSLRLGIYFSMSPNFWLNLQNDYEQECLKDILENQEVQIKKQIHPLSQPKINNRLRKSLNKTASLLISALNAGIIGYNLTVGHIPGVQKLEEVDVNKTIEEVAKGGGSSFAVGLADDAVKLVRRVAIP